MEQQGSHLGGVQGPRGTYAFNEQRPGGRRDESSYIHIFCPFSCRDTVVILPSFSLQLIWGSFGSFVSSVADTKLSV